MGVVEITSDSAFSSALSSAGSKLVVVDFYATWCGPCKMIAPGIHQLSTKYPNVLFYKVDVDKLRSTASQCGITAMPTFQFFRSSKKLGEVRGADLSGIENKIIEHNKNDTHNLLQSLPPVATRPVDVDEMRAKRLLRFGGSGAAPATGASSSTSSTSN